jgi:predicted RNase H-like HicB family nuclease
MEAKVNGYVVVVEQDEAGGYSTWSPDLPGCVAAAETYDECVQLMREAVQFHLESMREDGEPIPEPTAVAALTITTSAA